MSIRRLRITEQPPPQVDAAIDAAAAAKCEGLQLAGTGLLQHPELCRWIARAFSCGLREIDVRTNHLDGAAPDRLSAMRAAGLRSIEIPWLTHRPAVHDVARPGAFDRLVQGGIEVTRAGIALRLRWMLSGLNASDLVEGAAWLADQLPCCDRVGVDLLRGKAGDPRTEGWLRSPQQLAESLGSMFSILNGRGISARIASDSGIPACLLHQAPELCARFELGPRLDDGAPRKQTHAQPCAGCAAMTWCPGIGQAWIRAHPPATPLAGMLHPFVSIPAQAPRWGERGLAIERRREIAGRFNRLRPLVAWSDYVQCLWDVDRWREHLPGPVYIAGQDYLSLGLDGSDGPTVKLARMPCMNRSPEGDLSTLAPLSILVLAGVLRKHRYKVEVRDLVAEVHRTDFVTESERACLWDHHRLLHRLGGSEDAQVDQLLDCIARSFAPKSSELIGLSCETEEDLTFGVLLSRALKKIADVRVVFGGRVGRDAREVLEQHPEVDWVVVGEGEVPLLLLAASMHGRWQIEKIPNLILRRNGRVVDNPKAIHDLDIFEPPVPDGLDLRLYEDNVLLPGGPAFPYLFVRDCGFGCAFCGTPAKGQVRVRSPGRVAADLAVLSREHGVRRFYFLNTMINARPGYLEELIREMEGAKLDIEWTDCARPQGIDPGLFSRLRAVGCANLTWGLDAGTDRLQKLMHKGLRIDECERLFEAAHSAGIRNSVNIIAGLPHETEADREEIRALIGRLRPVCKGFQIHAYRFLHTSACWIEAPKFGLQRRAGGFDEEGGLRWEDKQEAILRFQKELNDLL